MDETPLSPDTPVITETERFSPFWPIFAVFVTLTVFQLFNLRASWLQRVQIRNAQTELRKAMPQAQMVQFTAENIARDLHALAASNDVEAAKIVAEFKIARPGPAVSSLAPATQK